MPISALVLSGPGVSNAERERMIAAVLAWSQPGRSKKSPAAAAEAENRFEGYLRSRPAQVLNDLYRSLPASFRGGARG